MRIETKQAPIPSQPEVVLSDGKSKTFFNTLYCFLLSTLSIYTLSVVETKKIFFSLQKKNNNNNKYKKNYWLQMCEFDFRFHFKKDFLILPIFCVSNKKCVKTTLAHVFPIIFLFITYYTLQFNTTLSPTKTCGWMCDSQAVSYRSTFVSIK